MSTPQGAEYWETRPVEDMKKDWEGKTYLESLYHPHRQLIMHVMKYLSPFETVLEIGCNSAPNLLRITDLYPDAKVFGIDPSQDSLKLAEEAISGGTFVKGVAEDLGVFKSHFFDIVLADASYMYVKDIKKALDEAKRVCKHAIVICDWFSEEEEVKDFHYSRNYTRLLEDRGFDVNVIDITEDLWPSKKWQTNGKLFIAVLQSPTSKRS